MVIDERGINRKGYHRGGADLIAPVTAADYTTTPPGMLIVDGPSSWRTLGAEHPLSPAAGLLLRRSAARYTSAPMLTFDHLTLYRGARRLIQSASLTIFPGQKVGLTGANGSGKSSLFALLLGDLRADAGGFSRPAGWVIAHVAQETPAADTAAIDYVMAGDEELARLQQALRQAEARHDGAEIGALHARLDVIGGYTAHSRAGKLMHGLGFSAAEETMPVRSFSGGWRMRLNLARALMCRSDLLLLDEPTNHLDLDAVLWLEDWLRAYPGTLLLISHDRDFLDAITDHTLHLADGELRLYNGNYSTFERRRAEQLAGQRAALEKQQREIAHIRRFVDRFRAKASKARQAQSRLKALERMEMIASAHVDSPFHFAFRTPEQMPHLLLRLEDAAAGYGGRTVLGGIRLDLTAGLRLGLLGANGAGKSTLIKLLAGEVPLLGGHRTEAAALRIGYFAQHQLEQLRMQESPLRHLMSLDSNAPEQVLRDFLGGFGFSGGVVEAPVAPFSGGEKARLVLALLVYQRPNLLLLDEPTNHLDLEMRYALDVALQDYQGALVLVSHDRHLLRTVCDEFLLVDAGAAAPFAGDLEDYRRWIVQRQPPAEQQADPGEHGAEARKARRRNEAQRRQRLAPLKAAAENAEKTLIDLEARRDLVQHQLMDDELYETANKARLTALLSEQAQVDRELAAAEAAWLDAHRTLNGAEREQEGSMEDGSAVTPGQARR